MAAESDKKRYRRITAQRKKEHTDEELEQMSARITERIRALPQYRSARTVFAYMDLPGEVRMRALIRGCWEDGKTAAVPRVADAGGAGKPGTMHFYRIGSFDVLREGKMHIMEPDPEKCVCVDEEENALIIMPGTAFDRDLHRIGYGGGYYDRYLAEHPDHPTVAAAFAFQLFDRVPADPYDICPQVLVTEDGIYTGQ